jgi:hypothetical protein
VCNSWIALHVHLGKKSSAFLRLLHDNRPKKKKKQMDKKKCSFVFSLFPVLCEKFPLQIIRELTTSNKKLSIVRVFQQGALFLYRFLSVDRICNIYTPAPQNRFLCNDGRRASGGDRFLFYTHKQIKFTAGYVRSKRRKKKLE